MLNKVKRNPKYFLNPETFFGGVSSFLPSASNRLAASAAVRPFDSAGFSTEMDPSVPNLVVNCSGVSRCSVYSIQALVRIL